LSEASGKIDSRAELRLNREILKAVRQLCLHAAPILRKQ